MQIRNSLKGTTWSRNTTEKAYFKKISKILTVMQKTATQAAAGKDIFGSTSSSSVASLSEGAGDGTLPSKSAADILRICETWRHHYGGIEARPLWRVFNFTFRLLAAGSKSDWLDCIPFTAQGRSVRAANFGLWRDPNMKRWSYYSEKKLQATYITNSTIAAWNAKQFTISNNLDNEYARLD
jgi:hypothetical protein